MVPRPRPARRPARRVRIAVEAGKGVVLSALTILAASHALSPAASSEQSARTDATTISATDTRAETTSRVERLMRVNGCSSTGLAAGVTPRSALLRRDDHVRRVSFDAGWAAYQGQAPGTLVAVCSAAL